MPRRVASSRIFCVVAARAISMSVAMDGPLPVGARFSQSRKLRKREFLRPLQSYRADAQDDSGGGVKPRRGNVARHNLCGEDWPGRFALRSIFPEAAWTRSSLS